MNWKINVISNISKKQRGKLQVLQAIKYGLSPSKSNFLPVGFLLSKFITLCYWHIQYFPQQLKSFIGTVDLSSWSIIIKKKQSYWYCKLQNASNIDHLTYKWIFCENKYNGFDLLTTFCRPALLTLMVFECNVI